MKSTSLRPGSKIARVLRVLADGRSLNVFEGQALGDSCLNSTADRLRKYGVNLQRTPETVQGRFGKAHVIRYSLPADQREAAERLLAGDA